MPKIDHPFPVSNEYKPRLKEKIIMKATKTEKGASNV